MTIIRSLAVAVVLLASQGARECASTPPRAADGGSLEADAGPTLDACDDPDLACEAPYRAACVIDSVGYTHVLCAVRPDSSDDEVRRACVYACRRDGACDGSPVEVDVVRCR